MMPVEIASSRGVDTHSAANVAVLARRLAGPYATDPGAQNALAEAEYDAGNYPAARAAADRALARDAASIHAMLYAGMARAAEAGKAKSPDAAAWAEVRRWYIRANRADPEYATPLVLFYSTYAASGQVANANAQAGLLYARALAPFDAGLGMQAAYVLLQQGKPEEARAMLRPIAYNPHGGSLATKAGAVVAAIDKDGAKGGLKLLEAPGEGDAKAGPADDGE